MEEVRDNPTRKPVASSGLDLLKSRISYWLNRADRETHPKRRFESLEKARDLSKRLRDFKGFTKWWSAVSFAAVCMALIIGAAIIRSSEDHEISNPRGVYQILNRYDSHHYRFKEIANGTPLRVEFCDHGNKDWAAQLSAGLTINWLRYRVLNSETGTKCWDIEYDGYGYRLMQNADGSPTLAPNCHPGKTIYECEPNLTEARF